mgnify:CR=1 FL=1
MKRGRIRPLFCALLVRLGVRLLVRWLVRLLFSYARKALYLLVFCWFVGWFMSWFTFWFARCSQPLFLRFAATSRSCAGQLPEIPQTGVNSRFSRAPKIATGPDPGGRARSVDQQVDNACKNVSFPFISLFPFSLLLSPIPPIIILYPFISFYPFGEFNYYINFLYILFLI